MDQDVAPKNSSPPIQRYFGIWWAGLRCVKHLNTYSRKNIDLQSPREVRKNPLDIVLSKSGLIPPSQSIYRKFEINIKISVNSKPCLFVTKYSSSDLIIIHAISNGLWSTTWKAEIYIWWILYTIAPNFLPFDFFKMRIPWSRQSISFLKVFEAIQQHTIRTGWTSQLLIRERGVAHDQN